MVFSKYMLTVRHDRGKDRISTVATSEAAAKRIIMTARGCPERAILKCLHVKIVCDTSK